MKNREHPIPPFFIKLRPATKTTFKSLIFIGVVHLLVGLVKLVGIVQLYGYGSGPELLDWLIFSGAIAGSFLFLGLGLIGIRNRSISSLQIGLVLFSLEVVGVTIISLEAIGWVGLLNLVYGALAIRGLYRGLKLLEEDHLFAQVSYELSGLSKQK